MTKEFLKSLGIEGESAEKIIAQAATETTAAENAVTAKFGDYEDVKGQLEAANKQIEEFGKLDVEGLKKSAAEYKEKYNAAVKESEAKLSKMQFDHILESKLSERKPRNVKAVRALLDMEGLKLNNGEIAGLSEQLDRIVKENDYLFEQAPDIPQFTGAIQGGKDIGNSDNAVRAIMGLAPVNN